MLYLKHIAKKYMPITLLRFLRKIFNRPDWETGEEYGWSGDYATWGDARAATIGYDAEIILSRTLASARQVRDGLAVFERDSVVFQKPDYNWPLLASLMHVAALRQGRLHVIDFGGALGSVYSQNRRFLDPLTDVVWCVVEQSANCTVGQREFSDNRLYFNSDLREAMKIQPNVILLSGVLQYLQAPYEVLREIIKLRVPYIIIDRTGFTENDVDRLTIQRVPPWIYSASYPCWFFGKSGFMAVLQEHYELLTEFATLDKANILSEYRGMLFGLKKE